MSELMVSKFRYLLRFARKGLSVAKIIFPLALYATLANAIDCRKAESSVDKSICGKKKLQEADRKMTAIYKKLRRELPVKANRKLLKMQQNALERRNDCSDKAKIKDLEGCLDTWYRDRNATLSIAYDNRKIDLQRVPIKPEKVDVGGVKKELDPKLVAAWNQYFDFTTDIYPYRCASDDIEDFKCSITTSHHNCSSTGVVSGTVDGNFVYAELEYSSECYDSAE